MDLVKHSQNNENQEFMDESDKAPNNFHVTFVDFGVLACSIFFHFVDLVMDAEAAYHYYSKREYWPFAWTVGINLISGIIISLISIRMYVADRKDLNANTKFTKRISLCAVGVVFQTAPLIRQCDSLKYAIKSFKAELRGDLKEQKRNFYKKLHEEADLAWLKVFECYLESAPTTVLQVALMLIDYNRGFDMSLVLRSVLLVFNFGLMGWSMATYHRCIRFDQEDKNNISFCGVTLQLLWHTNFTVSRILALSALASIYPLWTCVGIILHWCGMTVWVAVTAKTSFCGSSFMLEILFAGAVGLVYIFNFFSLKDKPTRKYYNILYGICFIENLSITIFWAIYSHGRFSSWIYYVFVILPMTTFVIGVSCAIIYYKFLHPNIIKRDINNKAVFYVYPLKNQEQKLCRC